MADFNLPTITSTYSNFVTELQDKFVALAQGLDPAVVTLTNRPTNAISWDSATNKWKKWNGTSYVDLSSSFDIVVKFTPTGGLTSITVQAALAELDTNKYAKTGGAITGNASVSGNMGVGTTSPAVKFVVSNSGAAGFEVSPNGGLGGGPSCVSYNRVSAAYLPVTNYALNYTFFVGAGGSIRAADLDSTGNLGIGVAAPADKLAVFGASGVSFSLSTASSGFKITHNGTTDTFIRTMNSSPLRLGVNDTTMFQIGSAGQWGIGGATYGSSGQLFVSGGASSAPAWATNVSLKVNGQVNFTPVASDPAGGADGDTCYNSTLAGFRDYIGGAWITRLGDKFTSVYSSAGDDSFSWTYGDGIFHVTTSLGTMTVTVQGGNGTGYGQVSLGTPSGVLCLRQAYVTVFGGTITGYFTKYRLSDGAFLVSDPLNILSIQKFG